MHIILLPHRFILCGYRALEADSRALFLVKFEKYDIINTVFIKLLRKVLTRSAGGGV